MNSSFTSSEIAELSEDYLVLMAASRNESQIDAQQAVLELYRRHADFLIHKLENVVAGVSELAFTARDLVWELFWELYDTETTTYDGSSCKTATDHRKNFRKWAFSILRNLFIDEIRKLPTQVYTIVGEDDGDEERSTVADELSDEEEFTDSEENQTRIDRNIKLVTEALDSLSEKEQKVARMLWATKSKTSSKADSKDLHALAALFEMTPDGIRQVEYRLREKIRKKLDGQILFK